MPQILPDGERAQEKVGAKMKHNFIAPLLVILLPFLPENARSLNLAYGDDRHPSHDKDSGAAHKDAAREGAETTNWKPGRAYGARGQL